MQDVFDLETKATVVYVSSDMGLAYPKTVYGRPISLLDYPTAVYVH